MTGRERLFRAIDGKQADHIACLPITMMFAADLIDRPYRDYVTDYRVLVEGQLRVLELFDTDHVNTLTDPAREAADCGADVEYPPDQPPAIREETALLSDPSTLVTLRAPKPSEGPRMLDRIKAVEDLRRRVGEEKAIEGWVEGPCAEAADLRGVNRLMLDFYDNPGFVEDLFSFATELAIEFADEQIKVGADVIGVGDAAASLIGPDLYEKHVLPFERTLIDAIHDRGCRTRLHICGDTSALVSAMATLGSDIIDLDFPVDMARARGDAGVHQVLLGNIDPVRVLRDRSPDEIQAELTRCFQVAQPRYVAGAGCEVVRDTPRENLRALIDFARETTVASR